MTIILIYTIDGYEVICIFTLHAIDLLYVDQSTETGFSFSSDNRDLRHNEDRVSNDLHDFLQRFSIGNGLTDLVIRCKAYLDYALEMGIIQQSEYKNVNKMLSACDLATKLCGKSYFFLHMTNHITNTDFYDNKQVHDVGHMVPMDQPKATLEMLKRWTKGKLVENTKTEDVVTDM
ncbi:hypothetical protein GIB67_019428 [Kingdonia uniflora]|uniref:Uncharacterized protein n=1 Tax=Kingdonia uniflora TaxID=39325 RepID=A0A7J7L6T1_9MAGN|nr:hypothetical protein GIB67_019428 [Kingdonia uniflora]